MDGHLQLVTFVERVRQQHQQAPTHPVSIQIYHRMVQLVLVLTIRFRGDSIESGGVKSDRRSLSLRNNSFNLLMLVNLIKLQGLRRAEPFVQ